MSKIVLLLTDVEPTGGVQLMGRQLAAGMGKLATVEALSLHDRPQLTVRSGDTEAPVVGFEGSKLRFARAAMKAAKDADLIFLGHPNFGALVPLLGQAPKAVLAYGIDGWTRQPFLKRRGLHGVDALGAISEYTLRRTIEAQGLTPRSTFILNPGLDATEVPPIDRRPWPEPTLLSVARLARRDPYKGVDDVIRVLGALSKRAPTLRYEIIGDGDDQARLEALAHSLGVADHVSFLGHVSDRERNEAFSRAHAFVLPSSEEGFGLVFIEAMAYGLPVVACAAAATPEVVADGETGLLVEKGNTSALASALIRLLSDPQEAARMGRAGHQRVLERFTLAAFERNLGSVCSNLLAPEAVG